MDGEYEGDEVVYGKGGIVHGMDKEVLVQRKMLHGMYETIHR